MACGFDMKFHYVLAGWEGSTTNAIVLWSALNRGDKLKVLDGNLNKLIHLHPLENLTYI